VSALPSCRIEIRDYVRVLCLAFRDWNTLAEPPTPKSPGSRQLVKVVVVLHSEAGSLQQSKTQNSLWAVRRMPHYQSLTLANKTPRICA